MDGIRSDLKLEPHQAQCGEATAIAPRILEFLL